MANAFHVLKVEEGYTYIPKGYPKKNIGSVYKTRKAARKAALENPWMPWYPNRDRGKVDYSYLKEWFN